MSSFYVKNVVRIVSTIALSGLVLAACGSSNVKGQGDTVPLAGKHTNLASSWIAIQKRTAAVLLTWTITGTSTEGNLTDSYLDSSGLKLDTNTDSFTGVISGDSVTLNFSSGTSATGSVSTTQLDLQIPNSDGVIQSLDLVPGTSSAYNAAVGSIQSGANAYQAKSSDEGSINQAAETVSSDISSVSTEVSNLQSDSEGLQSDLQYMLQDEESTQSDLSVVIQDVNSDDGEACGDAGSVQGDAGSVQGDMGSVQGDESSANSNLSALLLALSSLRTDWSTYQEANAVLPSYVSPYAVTSSQEQRALAQGSQESSTFAAQERQDTSNAQSLENKANQFAATAQSVANAQGGC